VGILYPEVFSTSLLLAQATSSPKLLVTSMNRRHLVLHVLILVTFPLIVLVKCLVLKILLLKQYKYSRCFCTGSLQPVETDASAAPTSRSTTAHSSDRSSSSQAAGHHSANSGSSSYSAGNPYMSKHMYSSSFMSTEGSQSIQSLIGVQTREELGRSSSSSRTYSQVNILLTY